MAVSALAGAHRLAVDGDVTLILAFGATRGPQRLRQRAPVEFPMYKSSDSLDGKLRSLAVRRASSNLYSWRAPRDGRAKEGTMISAQEHVTMATVGTIIGAVLGLTIGGAVVGFPAAIASAALGAIGGAFFGSYL
jgi:hypothetical protein